MVGFAWGGEWRVDLIGCVSGGVVTSAHSGRFLHTGLPVGAGAGPGVCVCVCVCVLTLPT